MAFASSRYQETIFLSRGLARIYEVNQSKDIARYVYILFASSIVFTLLAVFIYSKNQSDKLSVEAFCWIVIARTRRVRGNLKIKG